MQIPVTADLILADNLILGMLATGMKPSVVTLYGVEYKATKTLSRKAFVISDFVPLWLHKEEI
ncbi:MAG: hypothetical protein F9K23_12155 [Bacteroidetes bacterium]|nr:MAG: hypothetical protein F9K23_12155 [Bacteroidota bacterium]